MSRDYSHSDRCAGKQRVRFNISECEQRNENDNQSAADGQCGIKSDNHLAGLRDLERHGLRLRNHNNNMVEKQRSRDGDFWKRERPEHDRELFDIRKLRAVADRNKCLWNIDKRCNDHRQPQFYHQYLCAKSGNWQFYTLRGVLQRCLYGVECKSQLHPLSQQRYYYSRYDVFLVRVRQFTLRGNCNYW